MAWQIPRLSIPTDVIPTFYIGCFLNNIMLSRRRASGGVREHIGEERAESRRRGRFRENQ